MNRLNILWAIRSKCNLHCLYCYFGSGSENHHILQLPNLNTQQSIPKQDVSPSKALAFAEELSNCPPLRIFISGGEPLRVPFVLDIIKKLKTHGHHVVVCTNGLPLLKSNIRESILSLGINAVSVSLDSHIPVLNDSMRRGGKNEGCSNVITGLRLLLQERNEHRATTRIGVYTVMTQTNIYFLESFASFLNTLGIDYWVYQPVSVGLSAKQEVKAVGISSADLPVIVEQLRSIQDGLHAFQMPQRSYLTLVESAIQGHKYYVENCFAGRDLFFIQPDGTIWDCPSYLRIRNDSKNPIISINNNSAQDIFSAERRNRRNDCPHFSVDCVNMWPLMSFNEFLNEQNPDSKNPIC